MNSPACFWPDGTWCWDEDLEDFLAFMSDDYASYHVPDDNAAQQMADGIAMSNDDIMDRITAAIDAFYDASEGE